MKSHSPGGGVGRDSPGASMEDPFHLKLSSEQRVVLRVHFTGAGHSFQCPGHRPDHRSLTSPFHMFMFLTLPRKVIPRLP